MGTNKIFLKTKAMLMLPVATRCRVKSSRIKVAMWIKEFA